MRPQLGLPALADAAHRPLAGSVRSRGRRAFHAGGRGDVHDVARLLRLHLRDDPIGDVDEPEDVGLEHRPHGADIEGADLRPVAVGGVVDEDIDSTHALVAHLDGPRVVVPGRDVGAQSMRAGPGRDLRDELIVAPREHDLVPRLARQFDDGGADALAASGHEKTAGLHVR